MSAAGKFREQITVYAPQPLVQNSTGGFSPAPAPGGLGSVLGSGMFPFVLSSPGAGPTTSISTTLWAKVEMLAAKESLENGKLTYKQPYRITIRFTNTITNVDRIEWRGKTIAINSVQEDTRRTEKIIIGYGVN